MRNILLSWWLLWAMPCFGAQITVDFRDATVNETPTNFQSVLVGTGQPGTWTILSDAVTPMLAPITDKAPAVASRPVLAQTSQDPSDERFPILVYEGETFTDFKLSTRFKIVSGVAEQMAGVVFRFQNASNFYVVRASALGHNVRFYSVINGLRSSPFGPDLEVTAGTWHTLTVQCTGEQITFGLDDHPALALKDSTFSRGKIGFWTKSDSVSYFSDLAIDYTQQVHAAAQTMVTRVVQEQSHLLGLRIYVLDPQGQPHVLASKDPTEIGRAGGDAEKAAVTKGTLSIGREPGTVALWLPYRDRNGDSIACVWVRMKSFKGETQDTAITRATAIVRLMQDQITSSEDLLQ